MSNQKLFMELFYSGCLAITNTKGVDYAPDNIPLLEVLETAVDLDVEIQTVMWIYFRKHVTALRKYLIDGRVESEPVIDRCRDASNYIALMAFYDTDKQHFHATWRKFWLERACEFDAHDLVAGRDHNPECQRCKTLSYLERRAFGRAFGGTSSRSTPKARG